MKLVWLTLAVLLLLSQAVPGRRHPLLCMGNKGVCRASCRKGEHPYLHCSNEQPCCLQSYMRISMVGGEEDSEWAQGNHWP
ncbi:beta-defensin 119 isoform X1 [Echinops telfairi]|uniref:Beta-defensin 119 isoform X1 n=1 Tax=Echinops telfairi TaxID=9371 RepID=A0AC55DIC8_ECHTE|nr:beta-defensin 119 isoform X1 [Echinops telfairi]